MYVCLESHFKQNCVPRTTLSPLTFENITEKQLHNGHSRQDPYFEPSQLSTAIFYTAMAICCYFFVPPLLTTISYECNICTSNYH